MARYKAKFNQELSSEDKQFYVIKCGLGASKLVDPEGLVFEAEPEEVRQLHENLTGEAELSEEMKRVSAWWLELE